MKKLVMAAAVLGAFAGAAQAQTSVTLYGIADGDVRFDHTNIGTLKSIGSGGESGSRWGLRGSEDLGGGLKANFVLEQGFDITDNSSPQGSIGGGASAGQGGATTAPHSSSGSRIFSRIATVGLSGPFGNFRFGRDYNPLFLVQATADPFGAGMVGQISNLYVNNSIRNDNGMYYDTPRIAGFQASGVYQFGESTTDNPATQKKRGNDRYGLGLTYANGPLFAGVGYENIRSNPDSFRVRTGDAAVSYDLGVVKLMGAYWRTKNENGTAGAIRLKENVWTAGATVPIGAFSLLGQFSYLRDKSTYNTGLAQYGRPTARNYSGGVRYSLSKRTVLYTSYSRTNLKKGSNNNVYSGFAGIADASNSGLYTAGNLFDGAGINNVNPYSYQFGIRHSF